MNYCFAILLLFSSLINHIFALDPFYENLAQYNISAPHANIRIYNRVDPPIIPQQSAPSPLDYSLPQLKEYFADQDYTEAQILSQSILYMSDEFVTLAKTYPGYEAALSSLHKKID